MNVVDLSPDMMHTAEHEAKCVSAAWGKNTTDYNQARDVLGSLGEQAFNVYLTHLGLSEGLDYVYDHTLDGSGDCYDFRFHSGETLDVKTSSRGYDLLVKVESVKNRPCDFYVLANFWANTPPRVQLTGFATKAQVLRRKPKMLKALDYVVKERYLRGVEFFRRYKK